MHRRPFACEIRPATVARSFAGRCPAAGRSLGCPRRQACSHHRFDVHSTLTCSLVRKRSQRGARIAFSDGSHSGRELVPGVGNVRRSGERLPASGFPGTRQLHSLHGARQVLQRLVHPSDIAQLRPEYLSPSRQQFHGFMTRNPRWLACVQSDVPSAAWTTAIGSVNLQRKYSRRIKYLRS